MQAGPKIRFSLAVLVALAAACAPLKPVSTREVRFARFASPLMDRDTALAGWRFVIDPGHGGRERGAPSPLANHAPEADLNLAVSLLLGGLLQSSGAEVDFTRSADVTAGEPGLPLGRELEARARFSNDRRPDLFVSLHHNSSASPEHNRIEVYYKLRTQGPAKDAAGDILRELGLLYPGLDSSLLAGNFSVLRNLDHEGLLVECAYLSDRALAPELETLSLIKSEAEAIFRGVRRFATGSDTFTRVYRVEPALADTSAPPADTRPCLLVIGDSTLLPPIDRILKAHSEFSAVRVERLVASSDPSRTLLAIEDSAPRFVLLVRSGKPAQVVHYFRSATGERLARAIADRIPSARVLAGSEYLVTHTSMVALALTLPRPDERAISAAVNALVNAIGSPSAPPPVP
jgi:N-acetylmuramoyl-L-alanine amidase